MNRIKITKSCSFQGVVCAFAALMFFGAPLDAGTRAELASFHVSTPLPLESPCLGSTQSMSPAFAYVRSDSVFLTRGNIGCPLCVGCRCIISPSVLDSFILAPELRGLPLQASVRAWNNDTALYFLALGGGNRLIRGQYRQVTYDSTTRILYDTLVAPIVGGASANEGLVYYGIDTFHVSPSGSWNFRVFGNRGLRAATFSVNAQTVVTAGSVLHVADSFTVTAAGRGIYGTLDGSILDSTLGYAHPVKVFDRPVAAVNDSGAVADSGGFALREYGVWRPFQLGSHNLRDFGILKVAPPIGYGNQGRGAWGTHAEVWNDSFSVTTHFVKDDSTAWISSTTEPTPVPIMQDSMRIFTSGSDSTVLTLFDADRNPSNPIVWLKRSDGGRDTLKALWNEFQTGCAGLSGDTIACLPWHSIVPLHISWNHGYARLRFDVKRGHWTRAMGDLTDGRFYHWFSDTATLSYAADTSASWTRGDTLLIRFPAATYSLVHEADPSSLRDQERAFDRFSVRLTPQGLEWKNDAADGILLAWSLRNARGVALRGGRLEGTRGRIPLQGLRGVYWLEVRRVSDRGRVWAGVVPML